MTLRVNKVGQISITVHELPRALAFYQEVLGFPLLLNTGQMAFLRCGDTRLMLSVPERAEFDHPSSVLYFDVDDIQESYAALKDRDITFEGHPHVVGRLGHVDVWMVFFRDSEGNLLALQSEVQVEF